MPISPEQRTWLAAQVRKLAALENRKGVAAELLWRAVLIETTVLSETAEYVLREKAGNEAATDA